MTDLKSVSNWFAVAEPTTVQIALAEAGKRPHSYGHLNAKQYTWVDKKVWYYRKNVTLNPSVTQGKHVFLCFDGIDYFARVWLNGQLLGIHEGMFGGPSVEVSNLLKRDVANEIVVEVRSANYGNWDKFDYKKPGRIIKSIDQAGGEGSKPFFALGAFILPDTFRNRLFYIVAELTNAAGGVIFRSVYWPRCLSAVNEPTTQKLLREEPATYDKIGESWLPLPNGPWLKPTAAKKPTALTVQLLSNQGTLPDQSQLTVRVKTRVLCLRS